jgi:AICAR transformylase/IMP cyclohydrolase PurH
MFLEVIIAGSIDEEARAVFEPKKRLKLFEYGSDRIALSNDAIDFKHIDGGFVFQDADRVTVEEIKNAKLVTKHVASDAAMKDAEIAYKVASSDQIKLCRLCQRCGDGRGRYGDDLTCRCGALCIAQSRRDGSGCERFSSCFRSVLPVS